MPMNTDDQRQPVVLLADHFVIEAEDLLANEAGRRGVMVDRYLGWNVMHRLASRSCR